MATAEEEELQQDESSLIPAITAIIAAAAAYAATNRAVSDTVTAVDTALGITAKLSGILTKIAMRMITAQIRLARSSGEKVALSLAAPRAVPLAVDDAVQVVAMSSRGIITARQQVLRAKGRVKVSPAGKDYLDIVPGDSDDPKVLARRAAQTVRNSAVFHLAEAINDDAEVPYTYRKTWHCLVGDTEVVASGVVGAARRWYEGELVSVTTANGRRVTMTPEHKVLTGRGWVEVQFLKPGDKLATVPVVEPVRALDEHHRPSMLGEIVDAALDRARSVGGTRIMSPRDDLNADVVLREGDVDIVGADSKLRDDLEAAISEPLSDLMLELPDHALGDLFALRHGVHRGVGPGHTAKLDGGGLSEKSAFAIGEALSAQSASFALVPQGYTGFKDDTGDRRTGGADFLAQRSDALTACVACDDVLSVEISSGKCHVYDLSTYGGYFFAEGIVVHNCVADARTRATHAFLGSPKYEYHTVDLGDEFVTTEGNRLRFPGDPLAPISETAHCRCHLTLARHTERQT